MSQIARIRASSPDSTLCCSGPQTAETVLRLITVTVALLLLACLAETSLFAQASSAGLSQPAIVEFEGTVQVSRGGTMVWDPAYTNQLLQVSDWVRTGERSRAVVRLSSTTFRMRPETTIRIPPASPRGAGFNLLKGIIYYFHRDKPGVFPVETPTAYAVVLGTEFNLSVAENGTTLLNLIDGQVALTNDFGRFDFGSGEAGIAQVGQKPGRTASIETVNVIQWCLYYPAILNPDELALTPAEQQALAQSLIDYRSGDLLAALSHYPPGRQPASNAEKIFLAGLLLSVGEVEKVEPLLAAVAPAAAQDQTAQLAEALRTVIAAVKSQTRPTTVAGLSSVLLAQSYYAQSRSSLEEALNEARKAVRQSPNFGFGWARLAELEFSFGRIDAAQSALNRGLELSPRNAEALALKGFLLSAENRIDDAIRYFEQAMAIDGALGNAWLGRGLCRIRQGHTEAGRQDLQIAATLEPQRALLRSYLGKAFTDFGDYPHAANELRLARELDPQDPTSWLYSALLNQQHNRINEAVRDLQKSEELNDNRRLYRSRLSLDQDRAVRSVNLATIFDDLGMIDFATREASRATAEDPANYSAHLFLANSYQRQRDPKGILQRFETPAVNEYLLASLLAPVGGSTLAQSVSQQEYSKLFESDGFGVASSTEYLSRGAWTEAGAQYGTFGNSSYAVSGFHLSDRGQRPNNDLIETEVSLQLKQQITARDSLYVRTIYGDADAGDVIPRYDPATANTGLRVREKQEPLLLAGYHHEWQPGVHTLVLGGWFNDDLRVSNPKQDILLLGRDPLGSGTITDVIPMTIEQQYRNESQIFTAEAQQLWQRERYGLTVGARYQAGDFRTLNQHTNASFLFFSPLFPNTPEDVKTDFERWSLYSYYNWRIFDPLLLVAGLTYDHLTFPENFRFAPLSSERGHDDQLSPKAGLVWTPARRTTVRFGYSQSLGGVGFDQSFRLEPTQIAGFNQSFRSLIPESIAGANVDATFETWGLALEQQFGPGTFLGLSGELLRSKVNRELGAYNIDDAFNITPISTRENLDYRERSLSVTINQLLGDEWSLGARYRLSQARLGDDFADIPAGAATVGNFRARSEVEAILHQLNLFAIYNHRSGFFAQAEGVWYSQSNHGYSPDLPGDDFWQLNLFAGYRFLQRHVEARVGLLNVTDQDYRLNPLNITPDLPRTRTFVASLKFNF